MRALQAALAVVGASAAVLAACGSGEEAHRGGASASEPLAASETVAVRDAYVPAPPGDIAALYLTIESRDARGDRLLRAASPAAESATLHRSEMEDGRVSMKPVDGGIAVPAGGALHLEPGGYHVMLHGLRRELAEGDRVRVELELERGGALSLEAPVVSYASLEERREAAR